MTNRAARVTLPTMANATPTPVNGAATHIPEGGAVVQPKPTDRKSTGAGRDKASRVSKGKGPRDRADHASAKRLAEELAAATEQAATESAAREAAEAALAAANEEARALRVELAGPVAERLGAPPGRVLPFGDIDDASPRDMGDPAVTEQLAAARDHIRKLVAGAAPSVPALQYHAEANGFRPVLAVATRVVTWARADYIEVRLANAIGVRNPHGTGEVVEVEVGSPVMIEVDPSFDHLARSLRFCSGARPCEQCIAASKAKGATGPHAMRVVIVPDRQVLVGGHVQTLHDVRILQDLGPGSAAEHG